VIFGKKKPIAPAILNLHPTIICANKHFKLKRSFYKIIFAEISNFLTVMVYLTWEISIPNPQRERRNFIILLLYHTLQLNAIS